MRNKILLLSFLAFSFALFRPFESNGQQTVKSTTIYDHYRQAKFFFDSNNFSSAQEEFRYYLKLLQSESALYNSERPTVEYYIAMCSIYSGRPDAEILATNFVASFPESPYAAKLTNEIGSYFYESGDWLRAVKFLQKTAQTNVEGRYYLAIAHYKLGEFKEALPLFNSVKNEAEPEFSLPAAYYAGILHYKAGNYEDAIDDFTMVANDINYTNEVPLWICSSYVKLNRFTDLIAYVESVLKEGKHNLIAGNLTTFIAEYYFQKQDYQNAVKSFSLISTSAGKSLSRGIAHKFAFALFKVKQYDEALSILPKQNPVADSLDQCTAKTRALILIDQQKWDLAYQNLQFAASLNFNKALAEESFLLYLSLIQRNKQWTTLLKEIQAFQVRFPNNKEGNLLVSYALEALRATEDIGLTEHLVKIFPIGKTQFQELYQFMCYKVASNAFDKQNDTQATEYFKKSLNYVVNREMGWYARFALAEILTRSNKNSEAIKVYQSLLTETTSPTGSVELSQRIRLGLAYSFSFIAMYDRSLHYFEEYVAAKSKGPKNVEDLRNLAEIAIANNDLAKGLNYYNEAIQLNSDQTMGLIERKASILFNYHRFDEAVDAYQELITKFPKSAQMDFLYYRLNSSLLRSQKRGNFTQVITNTNRFIDQHTNTNSYFAPTLLLRAQAFQNAKQSESAVNDYIHIVRNFTADSIATEAILGAADLMRKAGRHEELLELQRLYASKHADDSIVEDQWLETCAEMFEQKKYQLVVGELTRFIQKYPSNSQFDDVVFMLGFASYQIKDFENSIKFLKLVKKDSQNATSSSWTLATIYKVQGQQELFINQLKDLKSNLSSGDTLKIAVFNELKAYYVEKKDTTSIQQIWQELEPSQARLKGLWALDFGQLAVESNHNIAAKNWFEKAILVDQDETGAKAALALAKVFSAEKDWKGSNTSLLKNFVQAGSPFNESSESVVGQAFLLMGENFIQLKNVPQAKAILQSILSSSSDNNVKLLAKKKLEEIQ